MSGSHSQVQQQLLWKRKTWSVRERKGEHLRSGGDGVAVSERGKKKRRKRKRRMKRKKKEEGGGKEGRGSGRRFRRRMGTE